MINAADTIRVIQIVKLNRYNTNFKRIKDEFSCQNPNINRNILVERKIIDENQNVNWFFDNKAKEIFKGDLKKAMMLSNHLKQGEIALSTSILNNTKNSAIALKLDDNFDMDELENYVSKGLGIGINFSNFNEPIDAIKSINSNFKKKEKNYIRPAAFIALLDINHPKIYDFITLKDKADYNSWCFDLSVVIDDEFMTRLKNGDNETKRIYATLLNSMKNYGEPGVIFSNNKDYLTDCCAAAPLKPNETLTVSSINLSKMIKGKEVDYKKLEACSKILSDALNNIDKNSYIGVLGYGDMLDKLNIKYGSNEANDILMTCLKIIEKHHKTTLCPTGTTSRILNTTPSIEPKKDCSYANKLKTLKTAYEVIDGQISTTVNLKNPTDNDIDAILKYCYNNNIKGITVFKI